jgi:hypothetical protein
MVIVHRSLVPNIIKNSKVIKQDGYAQGLCPPMLK